MQVYLLDAVVPPSCLPVRALSKVQVYILDAVAKMSITDAKDAESIVERVIPRLQHANSAVVLSAVKVGLQNQV